MLQVVDSVSRTFPNVTMCAPMHKQLEASALAVPVILHQCRCRDGPFLRKWIFSTLAMQSKKKALVWPKVCHITYGNGCLSFPCLLYTCHNEVGIPLFHPDLTFSRTTLSTRWKLPGLSKSINTISSLLVSSADTMPSVPVASLLTPSDLSVHWNENGFVKYPIATNCAFFYTTLLKVDLKSTPCPVFWELLTVFRTVEHFFIVSQRKGRRAKLQNKIGQISYKFYQ